MSDINFTPDQNARTGISIFAHGDGIEIDGWYDSFVGLGVSAFISWEQLDELRRKARRRKYYVCETEI